jgi:hypothetical protein
MDGIGADRRKRRGRVVLALALTLGVTPVVAADDQEKYAPKTVVAAERRLAAAGETLGAASMCTAIDRDRLRADILKINDMIDKGVDDNRQYYASKNIFAKGMGRGKDAIKRGRTDCRRAESDLTALEAQLGH